MLLLCCCRYDKYCPPPPAYAFGWRLKKWSTTDRTLARAEAAGRADGFDRSFALILARQWVNAPVPGPEPSEVTQSSQCSVTQRLTAPEKDSKEQQTRTAAYKQASTLECRSYSSEAVENNGTPGGIEATSEEKEVQWCRISQCSQVPS